MPQFLRCWLSTALLPSDDKPFEKQKGEFDKDRWYQLYGCYGLDMKPKAGLCSFPPELNAHPHSQVSLQLSLCSSLNPTTSRRPLPGARPALAAHLRQGAGANKTHSVCTKPISEGVQKGPSCARSLPLVSVSPRSYVPPARGRGISKRSGGKDIGVSKDRDMELSPPASLTNLPPRSHGWVGQVFQVTVPARDEGLRFLLNNHNIHIYHLVNTHYLPDIVQNIQMAWKTWARSGFPSVRWEQGGDY